MKRKLILPLLAIVFAIASAFASKPVAQMAYFHVAPNSYDEGPIDNTTRSCLVGNGTICTIENEVAYESPSTAASQTPSGVLKYN